VDTSRDLEAPSNAASVVSEDGSLLVSFREMEDLLVRTLERNTLLQEEKQQLQRRLEDTHVLLNTALLDLARAQPTPRRSTEKFIAIWFRQKGARL
jgi:regulator of replication initiation timing